MILGLGCDLLKISRIESLVLRNGVRSVSLTRFATRILHPVELEKFTELSNNNQTQSVVKLLSGSWCAKEAVYKTLDVGEQELFRFAQWQKLSGPRGQPMLLNEEYGVRHPREQFLISVSHDAGLLVATVLRQLQSDNQ